MNRNKTPRTTRYAISGEVHEADDDGTQRRPWHARVEIRDEEQPSSKCRIASGNGKRPEVALARAAQGLRTLRNNEAGRAAWTRGLHRQGMRAGGGKETPGSTQTRRRDGKR